MQVGVKYCTLGAVEFVDSSSDLNGVKAEFLLDEDVTPLAPAPAADREHLFTPPPINMLYLEECSTCILGGDHSKNSDLGLSKG